MLRQVFLANMHMMFLKNNPGLGFQSTGCAFEQFHMCIRLDIYI